MKIVIEKQEIIDIDKVAVDDIIVVKNKEGREVGEINYKHNGIYFLRYTNSPVYKMKVLREFIIKYPDLDFYVK